MNNDPFDAFGSTFPRSPKSENIFGSQPMSDLSGIFTLKSPLSVLATDMDANFTIRSGGLKTPRRCLLNDLAGQMDDASPEKKPKPLGGRRLFTRTQTAAGRLQGSPMKMDTDLSPEASFSTKTLSPKQLPDAFLNSSNIAARPPLAPPSRKEMAKKWLTEDRPGGISHWNQRGSFAKPAPAPAPLARHHTVQTLNFPQKKRDWPNVSCSMDIEMDQSPPRTKPNKLRRTQSMSFQPSSVAPAGSLDPMQEADILPSLRSKDNLKQISADTLIDLLDGRYQDKMDTFTIIDCRYPYEYAGGHVPGAINISCPEALEKQFFESPLQDGSRHVIIFHCEYSVQRAPRMALHFRKQDRTLNMMEYPRLYYPEMYLLQGGYRGFYAQFSHRCDPRGYVEMGDALYSREYKMEVSKRPFRKCFSEGFLSG